MQCDLPKTKSLQILCIEKEITLPKLFNCNKGVQGLIDMTIAPNKAFLAKIEIKPSNLKIYVDRKDEKGLCKYGSSIKIGSKNTNPEIIKEIGKVLESHIGEKINDIFSARLF
jgi:hypothetical protein